MRTFSAAILCLACSSKLFAQAPVMEPGPKSPDESLKCLKARPGFKVELMACEPAVMSPIAFAWGPDGKFWVVEMGDYPLGVDGKNKPGGKVKFLEKSRPDGPYDKATVFLDNLSFPTGVTPWGKGVLVCCAPDIFYAEDTKGTGKADKIEVLYTGFREGNQQHRVNGLVWGLDGWLYGANGESGGVVVSKKTGDQVNISGRDFRIKPEEGLIEAVSGVTQFGRCRDDWGNWFGNNNSNPLYHYVLEDRYLKRNPYVVYPSVKVSVSETPGTALVFPISKTMPRFNSPQSVNHFTSACSAIIYRDSLFGPDFAENSFVSEPVHNLVHREIMKPKGVTFTSKRAPDEQTSEFLASSDNWFRPTTIQTGPDGALWVADMYRYVIEHPEWIPKDWQKKLDLRAGHDKGRIYRVYPENAQPRTIPRMDKMNIKELVKALESPSGWVRDTAQRLLVKEKANTLVMGPLQTIFKESKNPLARLTALSTLDQIQWLEGDMNRDLRSAMGDRNVAVRSHAIALLSEISDAMFSDILEKKLAEDPDPRVRLQLGFTLGYSTSPQAGKILASLLTNNKDDEYLTAAIFSSIHDKNWPTFFAYLMDKNVFPPHAQSNLLRLITHFGKPQDMGDFLVRNISLIEGKNREEKIFILANLMDALEDNRSSLSSWIETSNVPKDKLAAINKIGDEAREMIAVPKASIREKILALRLVGRDRVRWDKDRILVGSLLIPQVEEDLQIAAVQCLGKIKSPVVPAQLLKPWKSYSPTLRAQVSTVLLSRPDWTHQLLDALEKKQVLPSEVDAIRRQKLLQYRDEGIQQRAAKILATASDPARNKVVMNYLLTVPAKGDGQLGKKLFAKHCAACHKLAGIGNEVGPDLASVPDKSLEGLLTAILDPNRAVEARYVNYVAVTKNGKTLSGVLLGETTTSITLVEADGKKHELLRGDLEELASTGKSPMPEGLERDISPSDMAHLIAFVRGAPAEAKQKK